MKIFRIIGKNFRTLLRSRTSAMMLLVGPLFIIVLVGLAFNTQTGTQLTVGVASKDATYSPLAEEFIKAMQDNKFDVVKEATPEECIDKIKHGTVHACIVFPERFEIRNNKSNELIFYVDQTRSNFVYQIQEALSSKVDFQSSKLSYTMTSGLLSVISDSKKTDEDILVRMMKLKASLDSADKELNSIKDKLSSMDLSAGNVSLDNVDSALSDVEADLVDWNSDAKNFIGYSYDFINYVDDKLTDNISKTQIATFTNRKNTFNTSNTNNYNSTSNSISDVRDVISTTQKNIDSLQTKLQSARDANTDAKGKADSLKKRVTDLQGEVAAVKSSVEKAKEKIDALTITNVENIVNPITTRIEPVVTKSTNLAYFFPYLVILIIMFISIMLASTLVVMEKNSRAYFRNFVTPTRDITMIIATFITNMIVVSLEVAVILGMAYYFKTTAIFTNIFLVIVLLLLSISLFTLIGMSLGYLLKSQEGTMLASIAVGSVFLLLSNLIIPLEAMAAVIQKITPYNPYVAASEVLRKLILFKLVWADVMIQFIFLGAVSMVIFCALIGIQRLSKVRYFTKMPHAKEKRKESGEQKDIPSFKLANGVLLTSLDDLIRELETMEEGVFASHVDKKRNDFYVWIKDGIEDKELAEKLKNKTDRTEFHKTLLKELEK